MRFSTRDSEGGIESKGMTLNPLGAGAGVAGGNVPDPLDPAAAAATYRPLDPTHFGVGVQWLIGTTGDSAADSFDMTVCSPSWFVEQLLVARDDLFADGGLTLMSEGVVLGRGTWFMPRWEPGAFVQGLESVWRDATPAPDFETFARRLDAYIPWEFRYRHEDEINRRHGLPRSNAWPESAPARSKQLP